MKYYQLPSNPNNNILKPNRRTYSSNRFFSKLMQILTPVLVFSIAFFALYYIVFKIPIFYISSIEITGSGKFVSTQDIYELASTRTYGKNIFTFSTNEFKNSLVKDFQGAKSIEVFKQFPNKVLIKVVERTPIAVVSNQKSQDKFLIDNEGYVLGVVEPSFYDLPKITYDAEISVGYFLNSDLLSAYFLVLNSTDTENLKASSMSLSKDYLSMYVGNSVEVLIGSDKDITKSIEVVSQLLSQLKAEGKNVKKIDLRFDKVIVSYR